MRRYVNVITTTRRRSSAAANAIMGMGLADLLSSTLGKKEKQETAHVEYDHMFKDNGSTFEVDGSFLDVLRTGKHFDNGDVDADDASSSLMLGGKKQRELSWSSEPWSAQDDEQPDVFLVETKVQKKSPPPLPPRTESTEFLPGFVVEDDDDDDDDDDDNEEEEEEEAEEWQDGNEQNDKVNEIVKIERKQKSNSTGSRQSRLGSMLRGSKKTAKDFKSMGKRLSSKLRPQRQSAHDFSHGNNMNELLFNGLKDRRQYLVSMTQSSILDDDEQHHFQSVRSEEPLPEIELHQEQNENEPDLTKYRIMLKARLPEGAVVQKMMIEGVDPALLGLSC